MLARLPAGHRRAVRPRLRARRDTNPCISCNGFFRFARLLAFARQAGAGRLATGHYARIVPHRGRLLLARATDGTKDQSYMLARLAPRVLDRIWFPLGEQTKDETRAEAARAGLAVAGRTEPGGVLPRRRRLPRVPRAPRADPDAGEIVDEHGEVVGSRQGFWPGSLRDSGRGSASPPVPRCMPSRPSRRAIASSSGRASRSRAERFARRASSTSTSTGPTSSCATARRPSPGNVEAHSRGFRVVLDEPVYGAATGQAAVLYERDVVVGAGPGNVLRR